MGVVWGEGHQREEENEMLKDIQKFFLTKQLTDPEQNKSNPFSFMDQLSTSQIGFLVKDGLGLSFDFLVFLCGIKIFRVEE